MGPPGDDRDDERSTRVGSISRREMRRIETRDALVAAANRMFDEVGYDTAKTDDIAAAANVAQATLFRHFETKADLALFHLNREVHRVVTAVLARPNHESPYQAVVAVVRDPGVLAALTSPAVQVEGERIARYPELAARVHWMMSDIRDRLATDFAARLGVDSRSPRAWVLASVVVDIATYTMDESRVRDEEPGDIFLSALNELRALLDPTAVIVGSGC